MLKIYDDKSQIPESLVEHYERRADGKYEPQFEGINSIGGLIAKRDELLGKVKHLGETERKLVELEKKEILTDGKVAVDAKEFETLKAERDAYAELGNIDDIKPKVEGFEELKQKQETLARHEKYREAAKASGITNVDGFLKLADIEKIEPTLKKVQENGKSVDKYFIKTLDDKGKETEVALSDYITQSPTFAPFADSLTTAPTNGAKLIKQGTTPPTASIETEKEALAASGRYGL